MSKILWRDTFMGWPGLKLSIQLMPWHWQLRYYHDDIDKMCFEFFLGPIQISIMINNKPFALERYDE